MFENIFLKQQVLSFVKFIKQNFQDENNWKSKYFLIFDQNCKLVKSNDEKDQKIKKLEKKLDKVIILLKNSFNFLVCYDLILCLVVQF